MEINVQNWSEVRSLKRPELAMLTDDGLIQTCSAKNKKDAITAPSLPKLVRFDIGYVENYFLQHFYEILIQEFSSTPLVLPIEEPREAGSGETKCTDSKHLANVKETIVRTIDEFTRFLREQDASDPTTKAPLELYREYRKHKFGF
ncbi:hypothetical protein [Chroococcidiopsis sp.]|uniref:hypothetical protein n=1 Tax=Chroococcidiopsis sp. TaxID=3088168 RepID=UPI003F2EF105